MHGRWKPEATEEHRTRILSAQASTDRGLDGLAAGVLSIESIEQMLRPHPELGAWRLAPVLRAYPSGSPDAQALVGELLDAIAVVGFPGLDPDGCFEPNSEPERDLRRHGHRTSEPKE
ncbi:hypothetical protein ACIOK4_44935 [Streptomyces bottropensis]|uniref:hypothetical protein n=1 Tax=Streptomyces bottropensis TaxID=42235 RepID=UPI0037FF3C96